MANPSHIVTFRAEEPRENATVQVSAGLIENIPSLPRSAIVIGLRAFSDTKMGYRIHYKKLMLDSGYSKEQAMRALRQLTNKGVLRRIGHGSYIANKRGNMYPAKQWELNHAQGCGKEQLRLWATIKQNEGMMANPKLLAETVKMFRTNVLRALNDREAGAGLYTLQLITKHLGRWYTPTGLPATVSSMTPAVDEKDPTSTPPTCVRALACGKDTSFFRISKVKIKIKNSILALVKKGASRQGSSRKFALCKLFSDALNIIPEVLELGGARDEVERYAFQANGDVGKLLELFPWTAQMGSRLLNDLVEQTKQLNPQITFQMVKRALRWVGEKRPHYNQPYGFLKKWLSNKQNRVSAARDLSWWDCNLDPDDPSSDIYDRTPEPEPTIFETALTWLDRIVMNDTPCKIIPQTLDTDAGEAGRLWY